MSFFLLFSPLFFTLFNSFECLISFASDIEKKLLFVLLDLKISVFSKFNDWIKIYDKEEEKDSLNFLKKSRDELYLMTLIDNDYVTNQLENLLEKFTNSI